MTLQNLSAFVQEHITKNYPEALSLTDKAFMVKAYITKCLKDNEDKTKELLSEGYSIDELTEIIYSDMAEYSVLTEYLKRDDIEEININGWDDIAVTTVDGITEKIKRHFYSPSHATDVIKRLLHVSGMVIDNATPISQGHLPNNTRITAIKDPVVDKDRGIAVSIRIIHMNKLDDKAIIETGFATDEMVAFLEMCLRYGVSTVIAGRTSSGKTTLVNALLATIPEGKRIYTIETGAREMDLVKRDKDGNVTNNVIHTLSRTSENKLYEVSQEDLVVAALRFDPDIICVGEMRDSEANAAVEASFTGHTLISTVHSGPGEAAHRRIALLCQRRFAIDFDLSLMQAGQAFPIVAFTHKLEDGSRKLMDITECMIGENGKREYRTLYRYVIDENKADGEILGHFEKVNVISDPLRNRLLQYGVPEKQIDRFIGADNSGRKGECR